MFINTNLAVFYIVILILNERIYNTKDTSKGSRNSHSRSSGTIITALLPASYEYSNISQQISHKKVFFCENVTPMCLIISGIENYFLIVNLQIDK